MKDKILTVEQARELDQQALKEFSIPSLLLMENAARGLAETILDLLRAPPQSNTVVFFCGSGNNGGDGFAAARLLHQAGIQVEIVLANKAASFTEDAGLNYRIINSMGIPIVAIELLETRKKDWFSKHLVIVDALLGTGFKPPLRAPLEAAIAQLNDLRKNHPKGAKVVAADIPSGINGDTGPASKTVVKADVTATFACLKPGLLKPESQWYTGKIIVVDIGIPKQLLDKYN